MTERRDHTWVTYALIAANLAMFAVELAQGVHPTSPTAQQVLDVGANFGPRTTTGEWWRLGSAMFLHFGLLHLGLNMLCLWQGRIVETLFGRAPFIVIYLLAGLAGGLASVARSPLTVSAGASGAVFGIYGAFGAILVLRRSSMHADVWRRTARGLGMFVAINLIFGFSVPNIDMTAHIGGLIAGFLVGAAFLVRTPDTRAGIGRTAAVALGGAALLVAGALAIPHARDPGESLEEFALAEARIIKTWEALDRRGRAPDVDPAALAVELERDVLGPWRTARAKLNELADDEVPGRLRSMFTAIRDYAEAREGSWEMFAASLRARGEERQTMLDAHHLQEREVLRHANVVRVEIEKLQATPASAQ